MSRTSRKDKAVSLDHPPLSIGIVWRNIGRRKRRCGTRRFATDRSPWAARAGMPHPDRARQTLQASSLVRRRRARLDSRGNHFAKETARLQSPDRKQRSEARAAQTVFAISADVLRKIAEGNCLDTRKQLLCRRLCITFILSVEHGQGSGMTCSGKPVAAACASELRAGCYAWRHGQKRC